MNHWHWTDEWAPPEEQIASVPHRKMVPCTVQGECMEPVGTAAGDVADPELFGRPFRPPTGAVAAIWAPSLEFQLQPLIPGGFPPLNRRAKIRRWLRRHRPRMHVHLGDCWHGEY